MPRLLATPQIPVVTGLPAAGKAGRLLSLLSDGHVYHDNGVSWDDLSINATFNMPWVRTGSNSYHCAGDIAGFDLTTVSSTALQVYYLPFSVPKEVVLTQIGIRVVTAASGTGRVGIYANDGSGATDRPGALLAEGASALDTSTADMRLTSISITLKPGTIYWAASVWSAAISMYSVSQTSLGTSVGRILDTTTIYKGFYEAVGSAALPANAGTLTYGTNGHPAVYLIE